MSKVNEKRFLVQYESCKGKYKLNESVCNSKQKWSHNECRCNSKELDDWDSCEKGYMWNPSTCDCECNKVWKTDEYLHAKICSCEKLLIGKLVLEFEDQIFKTTETLLNDKKQHVRKIIT